MESLHSDGSATYLLIIWVEKNIPLGMKTKQKPYPSIVFLSIVVVFLVNSKYWGLLIILSFHFIATALDECGILDVIHFLLKITEFHLQVYGQRNVNAIQ